jgi:hypothetical protein
MRFGLVSALSVAAVLSATTGTAHASGCGARATECYQKVRTPDVYATVERQVVVRPGYHETVQTPAVIGVKHRTVEVQAGRWHAEHIPAQHATVMTRQMVRPATAHFVQTAPVYATQHQTVVVQPAGVRWEHRRGLFGRETMCKVETPAVTQTVARQVMVSPGYKVPVVSPAVYQDVPRTVVVSPSRTRHVYQAPVHQTVAQTYVARPAMTHVVAHPAVVATERHNVLVRHGQEQWQATGSRHW